MPCLPGKVAQRHGRPTGTKRAPDPAKCLKRLPRKTKMDVAKYHLPRKTTVCVTKGHACHAKWRVVTDQAHHQTQPSATPATQNEGECRQVPRLPRETKVDVTKCHACHAKWRGVTGNQRGPSAPPGPAKCQKCHICHAKRWWMSPSATPAMQSGAASRATNADQARHQTQHKCHTCHAKRRRMSPSVTPATQSGAASRATNQTQPRVTSATPATQKAGGCRWCVTKMCVKDGVRYVKDGVSQRCV